MPDRRHPTATALGKLWEQEAAAYLECRGIRIVARGYRCRLGELDIIGADGDVLVVIEVRARRQTTKGSAVETVGHRKRQRLILATRHFLMNNPAWQSSRIRFDVVAIDRIDTTEPVIRWVRNAFAST